MPSLGGSGSYGGDDPTGGASRSSSGDVGSSRNRQERQEVTASHNYNLADPGLYGDLRSLRTQQLQRQAAEDREAEARAIQQAFKGYTEQAVQQRINESLRAGRGLAVLNDPTAMYNDIAGQATANIKAGGLSPDALASNLGTLAEMGRISTSEATRVANQERDRGFLGEARDSISNLFGAGYSRDISPQEFENRLSQGTLGTALSGLEQGLLQTSPTGEITADKFGQALEAFDAILTPFAVAGGTALTGGLLGGSFIPAVTEGLGSAYATSAFTDFNPSISTGRRALEGDYMGALATVSPVGEFANDISNVAAMNRSLGLSEFNYPTTSTNIFNDTNTPLRAELVNNYNTVTEPTAAYTVPMYNQYAFYTAPTYDRFGIRTFN